MAHLRAIWRFTIPEQRIIHAYSDYYQPTLTCKINREYQYICNEVLTMKYCVEKYNENHTTKSYVLQCKKWVHRIYNSSPYRPHVKHYLCNLRIAIHDHVLDICSIYNVLLTYLCFDCTLMFLFDIISSICFEWCFEVSILQFWKLAQFGSTSYCYLHC